jgi:hypothetical protein
MVVELVATAIGSLSRPTIIGSSAERAACDGGAPRLDRKSSPSIAAIGRSGTSSSAMRTIRLRSEAIRTRRYGYRSASAASTVPPMSQGRKLTAKAAADSSTDSVCW